MGIWIQSLSWTLIYALGQGFLVFSSLWLVLKLVPTTSAKVKYHLSLAALTTLLVWFVSTWWQQFHSMTLATETFADSSTASTGAFQQQLPIVGTIENYCSFSTLLSSIQALFPWLSVFYLVGLVLMLLRLSTGILQLFTLKTSGISQADAKIDELLISLKNRLTLKVPVQLFISVKAQVPMVIGFFKPIILMPAATMAQLSPEQLESILLHELAHIKRYDYLVNILQTIVETILFFNPFVWMISSNIRQEREHCCDDLVLEHSCDPLYYATALSTVASHTGTVAGFVVAATGSSNLLFNRIKRIMEMKKNPFSYSRMIAAILIVSAITCSIAWVAPSFDLFKKEKPAEPPISQQHDLVPTNEEKIKRAEETQLINQLIADKLIVSKDGYIVDKRIGLLFINGQQQTGDVAAKYLPMVNQVTFRIVQDPEGKKQENPTLNFLQLLPPQMFPNQVDSSSMKDRC